MKKYKNLFLSVLILVLTISLIPSALASAEPVVSETLGARYKVEENLETNLLRSGIVHVKDSAWSSTDETGMSAGGSDASAGTVIANKYYEQSVNVLSVPSSIGVRVVNWTMNTQSGWTRATVKNFAKDFEKKNPGWTVVGAVNGDFFDINSKGALPLQTSGVAVSEGEVYRPIKSSQTVGFTNNGTENSFVASKSFTVDSHMLDIYDEEDNVIATYPINTLNEAPEEGEIGLYYTYPIIVSTDPTIVRENIVATTPDVNSFLVTSQYRGIPMGKNNFYGNGAIASINESLNLNLGQFAIVTDNEDVKVQLALGTKIRVQQPVTGDYAECDNILGAGVTLLKDGEGYNPTDRNRHPRTMVGVKADGTIVLATVDGRQVSNGMHGMLQEEMAATMLYYGCVEAYNLDGGGSTTMIIKEGYDFRVLNSPSDGSERLDSNAILVVVPEVSLKIDKVHDNLVSLYMEEANKEITIENVLVTINGQTKPLDDNKVVFDDLEAKKDYQVNYTYDLTYKGKKETMTGVEINVTTGKRRPVVEKFEYYETSDAYKVTWEIVDEDESVMLHFLKFGSEVEFFYDLSGTMTVKKSKVGENDILMRITGHWSGSPSQSYELEFEATEVEAPIDKPEPGKKCSFGSVAYLMSMIGVLSMATVVIRRKK